LRGGNQSDDSVATSRSTLTQSTTRCVFSADCQNLRSWDLIGCTHSSPKLLGKVAAWIFCWLLSAMSREEGKKLAVRWRPRGVCLLGFLRGSVKPRANIDQHGLSQPAVDGLSRMRDRESSCPRNLDDIRSGGSDEKSVVIPVGTLAAFEHSRVALSLSFLFPSTSSFVIADLVFP
jgi:hypothetical protein